MYSLKHTCCALRIHDGER